MAAKEITTSNITDIPLSPAGSDQLGQLSYIEALSNFIVRAETPMTIAVQGEWGCGKTSLMNAIAGRVCANFQNFCAEEPPGDTPIRADKKSGNYLGVWVNTWQYSILKSDIAAQLAVIQGLTKELSAQMDELMGSSSKVRDAGRRLRGTLGALALTAAKVGASAAGINPESFNNLDGLLSPAEAAGPEYFREKLADSVAMYLEQYNENRKAKQKVKGIIFFVDDLDRLDPPVAVQVLSLLKNLFEVPNCIFMLAIDYEVVVEGLSSRFGVRTEKNEREFRSFFDKIIQLTFRVPIEGYAINQFLHDLLIRIEYCDIGWLSSEDFMKSIEVFTINSCGRNPRSIKRMINTLSLVREIHRLSKCRLESENPQLFSKLLYGIVCIQSAYPRLYDEILRRPNLWSWFEQTTESVEKSDNAVKSTEAELEELTPDDIVLEDALLTDPWIRKRSKSIQRLLFMLFDLIMRSKIIESARSPESADNIRNTKDYMDQILSASRFTTASDDSDDNIVFNSLDEYCSFWIDQGMNESILKELQEFNRRLQLLFDGNIDCLCQGDIVTIRAVKETGGTHQLVRIQVTEQGLVMRVGMSYRIAVGNFECSNGRFSLVVRTISDIKEADTTPIKARYKAFMRIRRLTNSWSKTAQDESDSEESSDEDSGDLQKSEEPLRA